MFSRERTLNPLTEVNTQLRMDHAFLIYLFPKTAIFYVCEEADFICMCYKNTQ